MNSMQILFVADVPASDPISGSEQVLYQQVIGLSKKRIQVKAITRQEKAPDQNIRDIAPGALEGTFMANPGDVLQFFGALIRHPGLLYDRLRQDGPFRAVICHQPFTCLALLLNGRIRGIPMLYVFHSPSHEEYLLMQAKAGWLKNLQAYARRLIEGYCIKRAAKVTTLSRFMADKVREFHKIPEARIVVNPGGVDLARFAPLTDRAAAKRELGFPDGKIHLLTIRNLEPRMGVDNLVHCIGILRKAELSLHLTIGGNGVDREKIHRLIRDLGLADDITMTGFIPSEKLAEYYGAADFFVLPTRSLEGFGLVTPESLATGTPVLGTPVGGTLEILSQFDRRFIFKDTTPTAMATGIKEAIAAFTPGSNEYEALRQRCRCYAETNYSWARHNDQLLAMLKEIGQVDA